MISETNILNNILGDGILNYNHSYILFGADIKGADMYGYLHSAGYKVLFFVDNDVLKHHTKVCGLEVFPPSVLHDRRDCFVIIASHYIRPIMSQLKKLGVVNMIAPKIVDFAPFGPREVVLREISENQDKINMVLNCLEDELSRKTLNYQIEYCRTLNTKIFSEIYDPRYEQYFDGEIIRLGGDEVFVDGGSCRFETSLQFINKVNGKYKKIYAFEPDAVNYSEIVKAYTGRDNVEFINRGIYSDKKTVQFIQTGSYNAKITTGGNSEVQADSLDHLVQEPTFIKFDIEGCEYEGLVGSERLIREFKPKLAICVYHKLSDLWRIPLLIKEYYNGYRLYLRHYCGTEHLETVCYAAAD